MQPMEPVEPDGYPHYVDPVKPVEPVAHPHYVEPAEPVQPIKAIPPLQAEEEVYPQAVQPLHSVESREPLVPANRAWDVYRASQVIYFALAVLETLLIFRIILRLLNANSSAPFTALVYGLTYPFVALFSGVFPSAGTGGNVLEVSSVLALLVYPLLAWVIVRIIHLAAERNSNV